ncbi:MAG: hypothetical protein LPK04_05405, partial [Caulobacteraceae bacterium]|nr:hypothetical protein [Caulobacteraceae bacterium]
MTLAPAQAPGLILAACAAVMASAAPLAAQAQVRTPSAPVSEAGRTAPAPAPVWRAVSFSASAPAQTPGGVLVLPASDAAALEPRLAGLEPAVAEAVRRAATAADFGFGERKTLVLRGLGDWSAV